MKLAPIALFVYNRPWHTKQTVESLSRNILAKESELFIFSDGPKGDEDKKLIGELKSYLKEVESFKKVTIYEKKNNTGLAKSVIEGVTKIVNEFGRVIVLEDDLITSPYFLKFMNDSLNLYEFEEKVISIHGFIYPVTNQLPETFFLRGADCWGWGTWKRGWDYFETNSSQLLKEINSKGLQKEFDFNNSFGFSKLLKRCIKGRSDSWAILWYASAFLNNKFTLYPHKSLVKNIGFDNSGTNCDGVVNFNGEILDEPIKLIKGSVNENYQARKEIENYFRSKKASLISRAKWHLKNRVKYSKSKFYNIDEF